MDTDSQVQEVGGFFLPSLPSPPNGQSALSRKRVIGNPRPLPMPRTSPLRPGSKHETALIRFLDEGLLDITRKYTKKYTSGGYYNIGPLVKDLERLVDLIWLSATRPYTIAPLSRPTLNLGTASLQVQYLLQIANDFNDYLASFQLNLEVTFTFLDVLDRCFYALITGNPANPNSTPISAPMTSRYLSTTEKVRLNSIIQRTRLHMVKIIEDGPSNIQGNEMEDMTMSVEESTGFVRDGTSSGTTPATDISDVPRGRDKAMDQDEDEDDDDIEWEMAVARVYELSLTEVGEQLLRIG